MTRSRIHAGWLSSRRFVHYILAVALLASAACVPEIQERCRYVTEHVPTPALPPAFLPVDHLLIRRAICMTQEARGLQGVLARPFRIYFADETLPILCGRLEEARQLALGGRAREAGRKYQSLLLASQVFELAIAVHAFSEYADRSGVPSPKIMEMQDRFAEQIGPLLAAALSEDPAQIRRALSEHETDYGAWTAALERWAGQVGGQEQKLRVARIVWDIGMLVVATYEAAGEAAALAASRRPPGTTMPAFAGAGGATVAPLSATASLDLIEALRKLVASGALDAGVVVGLSHLTSGQGSPARLPAYLFMERLDPSTIKPGMDLDPTREPIFRGGADFTLKPGELKIDPMTGLAKPTHGVSLDANPDSLERFGGARQIKSIPPELKIVQRGARLEHFEIVPRKPMSPARFQELLNQIELR